MANAKDFSAQTLQQRAAWLLSQLDGSVIEIAKNLGVNKNTIFAYKKCKGDLKGIVLENLVTKYKVNPNWLLSGEGEVFESEKSNEESKIVPLDPAIQILHEALEETGVEINEKQKQACLKILREELDKSDTKTKEDIKKYLKAFGE